MVFLRLYWLVIRRFQHEDYTATDNGEDELEGAWKEAVVV
jgi:hypothetical protein